MRSVVAWLGSALLAAATPWKVAVLHPLLGELASEVGRERVEVIDLIGPRGNVHAFEPTSADLRRADGARLFLISGMGLESYLPELRAIVGGRVVDIGASLPARAGGCSACAPDRPGALDHSHGIDPHWWHSIDRFRRAAGVVAAAFAAADPGHADEFQRNAAAYRARLEALEAWARREVARVPPARRHLATAHDAFGYFCADFRFTPHPVQGPTREQVPDAATLAAMIRRLREAQIDVIFPESTSNPKILEALTRDTGIRLGPPLIADGAGADSYEAMVRHNVGVIVAALAPERE